MLERLNPTAALIVVTLIFWISAVVLGDYTARNRDPRPPDATPTPRDVAELQSRVAQEPKNSALRLQLADRLTALGRQESDPQKLMEGISEYGAVLNVDSQNRAALLAMANISLENGVIDEALNYFPRYLALAPEDLKAQNDYALALVQANRASDALAVLEPLVAKRPDLFPAQLSLAVAYKLTGDVPRAKEQAAKARVLAPDAQALKVVDSFTATFGQDDAASPQQSAPAPVSPASSIINHFKAHPIIGPKLERTSWPDAKTVRFELKDFPIQNMPAFAKDKLAAGAAAALAQLQEEFTVQFVDAGTKAPLMEFKVGSVKSERQP